MILLMYKRFIIIMAVGFVCAVRAPFLVRLRAPLKEGESSPLNLTLRGAMAAAVDNNPDVLLYKERIEAARGRVQTQLGTMLPNLSSTVRQSRQTHVSGDLRTRTFQVRSLQHFRCAGQRDAKSSECQLDPALARLTRNASRQRIGIRESKIRHDGQRGTHLHGRAEGHGHGEDA